MIALILAGPPGDSHHLILAARRLGNLLIIEDGPAPAIPTMEDMATIMSSFVKDLPEPEPVYHVNGSLRYLYRPKIKPVLISKRTRYVIRQPCWRAGRWKSRT